MDEENANPNNVDAGWVFSSLSGLRTQRAERVSVQLPCGKDDFHYNMTHQKMGRCVILNFKEFRDQSLRPREGTDLDASSLQKTFGRLKFDVGIYHNLTLRDTIAVLNEESQRNHSEYNCFVLCILSHGEDGILHCSDGSIKTDKIFQFFTAERAKTLVGKPKLFFFQACRGDMFDSGSLVHDSTGAENCHFLIPNYADFLIFYSTFPGHFSWRNSHKGSWFIQELCNVLNEYADKYDLMTMLTIVCRKVAFNYYSNVPNNYDMDRKKQIPCVMSTLTRVLNL